MSFIGLRVASLEMQIYCRRANHSTSIILHINNLLLLVEFPLFYPKYIFATTCCSSVARVDGKMRRQR